MGDIMDGCGYTFGHTNCRRKNEVKQCIYGCSYLSGLDDNKLLQTIVEYLVNDDDITMARDGDDIARGRVIESCKKTISYLVDTVIVAMNNPRVTMEAEDIKAELMIAVDISINNFTPGRANFRTFVRWQLKGDLSNILRKLTTTDKRKITFLYGMKSIEKPISSGKEGSDAITLGSTLEYEETTLADMEWEEFFNELASDEIQIMKLMIEGYGRKEILSVLDISENQEHEILASIRIKTEDFLSE
jgi:RNA polymerase sigma factor (sigma-70 family)